MKAKHSNIKNGFGFFLLSWFFLISFSQNIKAQPNFLNDQLNYPRVATAYQNKKDSLISWVKTAGLRWPIKYLYFRNFKWDGVLEIWGRNSPSVPFTLIKSYPVCALSGALGPKRMEGDFQVPEGFYYINIFNPKSNYYLSLGLNYPNISDRFLSDSIKPGGDIYIHGHCTTVGCIPINDGPMEEVYLLAMAAKNEKTDFIPVHIFPTHYKKGKGLDEIEKLCKDNPAYKEFNQQLKAVFEYFEIHKKLPIITINQKGVYGMMP